MKDIKPTWVVAVGITVLFMFTTWVLGQVLRIDYDTIFDSTKNLIPGAFIRIGISATIYTIIGRFLNRTWGGGVYVQEDLPRLPGWMWVVPVMVGGAAVLRLVGNDWAAGDFVFILILAISMLFVGINEETPFRGIVMRALRGSTSNEFTVMIVSSVLFGVMHATNILNGAEVGATMTQILNASVFGAMFYITIRLTRSLLIPVLLHALIDFSIFSQIGELGSLGTTAAFVQLAAYLPIFIAIIAIFVSSRRAHAVSKAA